MTQQDYISIFNKEYSLSSIDCTFSEKIELLMLTSFLTKQVKKRNQEMTPYKVLLELVYNGVPDTSLPIVLEAVNVRCLEMLAYHSDELKSGGYKSATEIIARIKEILDKTLPF